MKTLRLVLRITNILSIILNLATLVYILANWKTLSDSNPES